MFYPSSTSLVQMSWQQRAIIQWARINDKPTELILRRGDTMLSPQIVRVELDSRLPTFATDDSGVSTSTRVTLFGVRGHPEIDDFDVQIWDTFIMENIEYTVMNVNKLIIGQIQAYCEGIG